MTKRPVGKGFSQEQVVGCEYEQGVFIMRLLIFTYDNKMYKHVRYRVNINENYRLKVCVAGWEHTCMWKPEVDTECLPYGGRSLS